MNWPTRKSVGSAQLLAQPNVKEQAFNADDLLDHPLNKEVPMLRMQVFSSGIGDDIDDDDCVDGDVSLRSHS
jgi:hypothetical protein